MDAYYNKFSKREKNKRQVTTKKKLCLLYVVNFGLFFAEANSRNGLPIVCTSSKRQLDDQQLEEANLLFFFFTIFVVVCI